MVRFGDPAYALRVISPRVIAGRWALTTEGRAQLPFSHDEIVHAFESARAEIARCLEYRKLPWLEARVRLSWSGGRVIATVLGEDHHELGACAGPALQAAAWPAVQGEAELEVRIETRRSDESD